VLAAMVHSSRAAHVRAECPATQAARAPFAHVFPPGCTMLAFV